MAAQGGLATMTLLVMLVTFAVWVWMVERLLDGGTPSETPDRPEEPDGARLLTTSCRGFLAASRRAVPSVRHDCPAWPLSEDELIDFGRALECSDDVVAELTPSR